MTTRATPHPPAHSGAASRDDVADPTAILKNLNALRQLTSLYPPGHQIVEQALATLEHQLRSLFQSEPSIRVDVMRGDAHLNGVGYPIESRVHQGVINDFLALGVDSVHFTAGVTREELTRLAALLVRLREHPPSSPLAAELESIGIRHISLGRLISLDSRWEAREWPEAPIGPLDPDYAESLERAKDTFSAFAGGGAPAPGALRDLLGVLTRKVAQSHAALGQILAVKEYENHTYCHSVNVSILSLLLGRQLNLDEPTLTMLAEGALLHDVGKTRIPKEILHKPAKLDARERHVIERHPVIGAAILAESPDLHALTPTLALEHHRHVSGGGYPDLGKAIPHVLSQIVAIADVYEAMTGARSYREPALPEQACLLLARLAGTQLNPALVKAFVNAITFFPVGTLIRTSCDEVAVVVRPTPGDPLHPVVALVENADPARPLTVEIDTSERDAAGLYLRHIVQRLHSERPVEVRARTARA
jgi:putative nucleotidyltransferase with HDIG domain